MDFQEYCAAAQQAAGEFERGEHDAAHAGFEALLARDLADLDKAAICLNLATIAAKRGAQPEDIVGWYDKGIAYERPHRRYLVSEHKADWLAKQDRNRESLRLYEEILAYPELTETDQARVRMNCESLRSAFSQYSDAARGAAALVEEGRYDEAIAVFRRLVDSDIADVDRSMMCYNLATTYEKKEEASETRLWYDRGISYETPHRRFLVAEGKAAWLARQGDHRGSARLYESLLERRELNESDRDRIRRNLEVVRAEAS